MPREEMMMIDRRNYPPLCRPPHQTCHGPLRHQVTPRSLVVQDEVGRGPSTHDGLAIAQAAMEHLHGLGCRTLFSTHYHELADAAEAMPHAVCMAMDASAGRHGVVFSYRVVPGRAGWSYGLKVAALAGLPPSVLRRAEQFLAQHTNRTNIKNNRSKHKNEKFQTQFALSI
jgi:DNA mismatch repair protein MutS